MRATLIYHPGGGSTDAAELERARERLGESFELEILEAGDEADPAALARLAVERGSRLLIACGGDGTVSSVASAALARDDVRLAILPRGTANSIAGHLGIPTELEAACSTILHGRERVVDTALANGRPMVLMATLGVHAEAITGADPAMKRRYGVLAYVVEEVQRMAGDSLFDATVVVDGEAFGCRASAITVANLAPATTLPAQGPAEVIEDDGLLDVTLIAFDGLTDAIVTALHLATSAWSGQPADRHNIGFFRAREVRVETREPKQLMIDGEAAGETPLEVRCVPRSLRVLVPQSA
jgi:YegS/Rv2252/BmrU family lipid kinase